MTDVPNPDPSIEELHQMDIATRTMLATFFEEARISPNVAAMLLANATGQVVNTFADTACIEHSLAAIFKIIRERAKGSTLDKPVWQ